jgi:hypothetical protein
VSVGGLLGDSLEVRVHLGFIGVYLGSVGSSLVEIYLELFLVSGFEVLFLSV